MSEYTPTTDEVRGDYAHFQVPGGTRPVTGEFAEGIAEFNRWLAEVERRASEKAWSKLADVAYPLYEAAEAVLLSDADKQTLMEPLAKLGARTNPYRRNEGEKE